MKLKRDGWLLRYAGIGNIDPYRNSVSLCELFWDCVGTTMLIVVVLLLIGYTGITIFLYPKGVGAVLVIALAAMVLGAGIFGTVDYIKYNDGVVANGIRGVKHKFCPVMEIQ